MILNAVKDYTVQSADTVDRTVKQHSLVTECNNFFTICLFL